ncbi:RDD family protein [Croceimicrobium hydrocarbonivorans]|uniref:RDD family protein n=1 Tax=Croceimicrobium hydrocarbonivorans TaxID=2761580 RepID=A0A7H0VA13_9FLAO|nr:RDD family protein [Croceimicrobium hydrocarbonivorans]QNR22561.1 RDD family protein [Croceimicrobium hydrocarbonivorans]
MESIRIQTSQNVAIEQELAGVGDRLIAGIIDLALMIFIGLIGFAILSSIGTDENTQIFLILGFNFILLTYHPLCEIFLGGASLGKRAMNLRVIRLDGSAFRTSDAIIRWLFSLIEIFMTMGGLATAVVALSAKGQRLGDLAAGTTVIKIKDSLGLLEQSLEKKPKIAEDYVPTFNGVLRLTDQEIDLLSKSIDIFRNSQDRKPMEKAKAMVEQRLEISSEMHPIKFLETIRKDYLYYSLKSQEQLEKGLH